MPSFRVEYACRQSRVVRRLFATTLLATASLFGASSFADDGRIQDKEVAAWVAKRVEAWQPTADERRFDQIGWVKDVREALRLAKEHNRPVFLFTHDGRMAIGRC